MIFVYPVVCSDNLDNRIVPAICKALEKFYLSNICEAFSSGVLIPKSKWDYYKQVYGPIVLENTSKNYDASDFTDIITESAVAPPNTTAAKTNLDPDNQRKVDNVISQLNQLNRLDSDLQRIESRLQIPLSHTATPEVQLPAGGRNNRQSADNRGGSSMQNMDIESNRRSIIQFSSNLNQYRNITSRYITLAERIESSINDIRDPAGAVPNPLVILQNQIHDQINTARQRVNIYTNSYNSAIKDFSNMEKMYRDNQKLRYTEQDREIEAQEREEKRKEKEAESYRTHGGSWKMSEVHGIGFDATMATVEVRVQYVGGDYDSRKVYNSDARVNMPVGVKLIPNIVPGDSIRYALLSDAFRSRNDQYVTTWGRWAARKLIKGGERFIKWVTGKNVDLANQVGENDVERQVIYAPQHLINASGFKRHNGSSDFYQFTSGVVILNKEELREIDDLLNDRNFMNRIIRLGWNSICVMDDVGEEALFISTVDGGYIHRLPYAYIFSAIGMNTTYDNIDKLQKHSAPFNRSDGRGFTPFGQKIMKESFSEMFDRIDNERDKSSGRSVPVSLDSDSYYGG